MRQFYVYIMTNKNHTVFYVGMTNNLVQRVYQHKEKLLEGFTKRYNLTKLVYYEVAETAEVADLLDLIGLTGLMSVFLEGGNIFIFVLISARRRGR